MFGVIILLGYYATKKPKIIIKERVVYVNRDSLCPTNVKYWLDVAKIKHDNIVFKQAMIESGNLNCTKCSMDKNNLFGFHNGKRYLEFNTWIESIFYYSWWQQKYYKGGDYYNFLDSIKFAADTNYIKKLK